MGWEVQWHQLQYLSSTLQRQIHAEIFIYDELYILKVQHQIYNLTVPAEKKPIV